MLVRQGEARGEAVDQKLAGVLAGIAGAINTAAFEAVGFFFRQYDGKCLASLRSHRRNELSNKCLFSRKLLPVLSAVPPRPPSW